jgi:hypothetical protein
LAIWIAARPTLLDAPGIRTKSPLLLWLEAVDAAGVLLLRPFFRAGSGWSETR